MARSTSLEIKFLELKAVLCNLLKDLIMTDRWRAPKITRNQHFLQTKISITLFCKKLNIRKLLTSKKTDYVKSYNIYTNL